MGIDPAGIKWDEPPPDDDGIFCPILSPKAEGGVVALIVSERCVGVYTHFLHSRTTPCTGSEHGCEGCVKQIGRRWKGYLGGWSRIHARYVLVELTHQAARDNQSLLFDPAKSLRGIEVYLTRKGRKANGPVVAEFRPKRLKTEEVPESFDVRRALLRVWQGRRGEKPTLGVDDSEIPE